MAEETGGTVPSVSHDPTKAAHDARKRALKEEKEARLKRLKDIPGELTIGIEQLNDLHSFLSILEQEKYSGKGKGNNDLATSISQIAQALTSVNKFKREKYEEES